MNSKRAFPYRVIGLLIIAILMFWGGNLTYAEPHTQLTMSISPTSGPPGTVVTVTGSGWGSNTSGHEIHWDSKTGPILGTFSTNPNGAFTTTIKIPSGASPGQHTIWVCDRCNSTYKLAPPVWISANFDVVLPPTWTPTRVPATPTPTDVPTECDVSGAAGEIVVDFESYAPGTNLKGAIAMGGVKFLGVSDLFVVQPAVNTHSGSNALQAAFVGEFGSGRLPMIMEFSHMKDFVGMYVGLEQTIYATEPITATLTAWTYACSTDGDGEVSCVPGPTFTDSVSIGPEPAAVKECLSVEASGIYRVEVSYGTFSEPEIVDDLIMRNPEEPIPVPEDEAPPIVSIEFPEEGYRHVEGELVLQGSVWEDRELEPALDVYFNGGYFGEVMASGYAPDYVFRLDSVPHAELRPNEFNEIAVIARDRAGNEGRDEVSFLYAPPPTPTPTPSLDIIAEAIEVTQVIQCLHNPHCPDNSLPLFRDKPTLIRLYVHATGAPGSVSGVGGELCYGFAALGDFESIRCTRSSNRITVEETDDPIRDHRPDINKTLNFYVPLRWTEYEGRELTFRAVVNPEGEDASECCLENNTVYDNVKFFKGNELNVVALRTDINGDVISQLERLRGLRWLLRYYPTSDIDVYIHSRDPIEGIWDLDTDAGWQNMLIRIDWIRTMTHDGISKPRYHALVDPDTSSNMGGMAWYPEGRWYGRSSASKYASRFGLGDNVGHELGHNHGLHHAPGGCGADDPSQTYPQYFNPYTGELYPRVSIGAWGIDLYENPPKLFDPANTPDLMSYCGGDASSEYPNPVWMSIYTYGYLAGAIDNVGRLEPRSPGLASKTVSYDGTVLIGSGWISKQSVSIDPPSFFKTQLSDADELTPDEGIYTVRLLSASESTLASYHFNPKPHENNHLPEEGAFFLTIPWHEGTRQIVFLIGEQILGSRVVSANMPEVDVIEPNGGEIWPAEGTARVRWSANDEDGELLSFIIQYSPDQGGTWQAIGLISEERYIDIQTNNLPGSGQALIRVCVSDGVNTDCDESDSTFTVPAKAPQVVILSPEPAALYPVGEQVILQGIALDPEDGSVPDGTGYRWSSDRDGHLGTGRYMWGLPLSIGRHVLTLEVTDSNGQQESASVEIIVGEDLQVTTETGTGTGTLPTTDEPSTVVRTVLLIGFIAAGLLGLVLIGAALIILVKRRVP